MLLKVALLNGKLNWGSKTKSDYKVMPTARRLQLKDCETVQSYGLFWQLWDRRSLHWKMCTLESAAKNVQWEWKNESQHVFVLFWFFTYTTLGAISPDI